MSDVESGPPAETRQTPPPGPQKDASPAPASGAPAQEPAAEPAASAPGSPKLRFKTNTANQMFRPTPPPADAATGSAGPAAAGASTAGPAGPGHGLRSSHNIHMSKLTLPNKKAAPPPPADANAAAATPADHPAAPARQTPSAADPTPSAAGPAATAESSGADRSTASPASASAPDSAPSNPATGAPATGAPPAATESSAKPSSATQSPATQPTTTETPAAPSTTSAAAVDPASDTSGRSAQSTPASQPSGPSAPSSQPSDASASSESPPAAAAAEPAKSAPTANASADKPDAHGSSASGKREYTEEELTIKGISVAGRFHSSSNMNWEDEEEEWHPQGGIASMPMPSFGTSPALASSLKGSARMKNPMRPDPASVAAALHEDSAARARAASQTRSGAGGAESGPLTINTASKSGSPPGAGDHATPAPADGETAWGARKHTPAPSSLADRIREAKSHAAPPRIIQSARMAAGSAHLAERSGAGGDALGRFRMRGSAAVPALGGRGPPPLNPRKVAIDDDEPPTFRMAGDHRNNGMMEFGRGGYGGGYGGGFGGRGGSDDGIDFSRRLPPQHFGSGGMGSGFAASDGLDFSRRLPPSDGSASGSFDRGKLPPHRPIPARFLKPSAGGTAGGAGSSEGPGHGPAGPAAAAAEPAGSAGSAGSSWLKQKAALAAADPKAKPEAGAPAMNPPVEGAPAAAEPAAVAAPAAPAVEPANIKEVQKKEMIDHLAELRSRVEREKKEEEERKKRLEAKLEEMRLEKARKQEEARAAAEAAKKAQLEERAARRREQEAKAREAKAAKLDSKQDGKHDGKHDLPQDPKQGDKQDFKQSDKHGDKQADHKQADPNSSDHKGDHKPGDAKHGDHKSGDHKSGDHKAGHVESRVPPASEWEAEKERLRLEREEQERIKRAQRKEKRLGRAEPNGSNSAGSFGSTHLSRHDAAAIMKSQFPTAPKALKKGQAKNAKVDVHMPTSTESSYSGGFEIEDLLRLASPPPVASGKKTASKQASTAISVSLPSPKPEGSEKFGNARDSTVPVDTTADKSKQKPRPFSNHKFRSAKPESTAH